MRRLNLRKSDYVLFAMLISVFSMKSTHFQSFHLSTYKKSIVNDLN